MEDVQDILNLTVATGTIPIKSSVGSYELSPDIPSVLRAKIQRWVTTLPDRDDEAAAEAEGVTYVARALKIAEAEAASWLPLEREAFLTFLGLGRRLGVTTKVPSATKPSDSSEPSTAA